MLSANEIRQQFIDYFVEKHKHTFVPSSSVVPHDDPTLMFTNAGMNQFKDVFLGTGTRPYTRAVDSQKCIRVSGKHNDLEEVGRDTYHHTFFEMLGNWSFGDYYKREAIGWAWELLTGVWGLDKSRLHATVFEGDKKFGVDADEEAATLWREVTDIDPAHIHRCGKADNFWMMGETGPCGPCSEIHIDLTDDKSGAQLVNAGDARVMEIWNLVFIQYNRDEEGNLSPLPARHVDTGMGFERIVAVLQDKKSNYDTDVFTPIMDAISDATGKKYQRKLDDLTDIAFRVVADHLRMVTFAITDGALPDNKGRGSVIRSVLRRAVRFCWQEFEQREPFVYKLVPTLVDHMGQAFPELKEKPDYVAGVIQEEEADFLKTIERGLSLFDDAANRAVPKERYSAEAGQSDTPIILGDDVFTLHTTHGFPPDLTRQMAAERGLDIDEFGYEQRMKEHERISRGKSVETQIALNISGLPATNDMPRWTNSAAEGHVLGWIKGNEYVEQGALKPADGEVGLILDHTCFYAEAGGQVGDRGRMQTPSGGFEVIDTQKTGDAVVHIGHVIDGEIKTGQEVEMEVDEEREFTKKNHTTTHLLHWALHEVLGDHIEQRGSKVKADEFTFDFSHPKPLTPQQKAEVERLVNEKIYQSHPVQWEEMSTEKAKELPGVRAFFGDKYGELVRVVSIGDGFSREFCGGTHLQNTAEAGLFKIVGEELVSKGIRRITAVTARQAVERMQQEEQVVGELAGRFSCQVEDLPERVDALQQEIKKLRNQLKKAQSVDAQGAADKIFAEATDADGAKIIVGEMPGGSVDSLRQQADRLRQKAGSAVIVLGWSDEGKVGLLASVTDDLVEKGLHAGKLVGQVAQVVGGKGGGRPTMAQAGGKDPAKLAEALDLAKKLAQEQLAG